MWISQVIRFQMSGQWTLGDFWFWFYTHFSEGIPFLGENSQKRWWCQLKKSTPAQFFGLNPKFAIMKLAQRKMVQNTKYNSFGILRFISMILSWHSWKFDWKIYKTVDIVAVWSHFLSHAVNILAKNPPTNAGCHEQCIRLFIRN